MKSILADIANRILKVNIHPVFCQYTVLVAQLKYTKNLYKNWIFRKFKYARKEKFYAPVICFG